MESKEVTRCHFVTKNPRYIQYHDTEWGIEVHDDTRLLEALVLELFQSGLSFECVLNKREALKEAFFHYDAKAIIKMTQADIDSMMQNPDIIRNRRKIQAVILNTQVFLQIQKEFGSFKAYLNSFTNGQIAREPCDEFQSSPLSDSLSIDLRRRGMKFIGTKTIYSFLQAVGIIQPHERCCFLSR